MDEVDKDNALYEALLAECSKYCSRLSGISVGVEWVSRESCYSICVYYRYVSGQTIPYGEKVPPFWKDMSPEFIRKSAETMIRYLIKLSFSVEVNNIFGWKGGFYPL